MAVGTAAAAAGVTVWAAYAVRDLNAVSIERIPAIEMGSEESALEEMSSDTGQTLLALNLQDTSFEQSVAEGMLVVPDSLPECIAIQYARALQEGRADEVIRMTHWMQERLKRVRLRSNAPEELEAAREELRRDIQTRTLEGNRLRREGVEDKYIFKPGATFEVIGVDAREDARGDALACPVKERTWLRVVYPSPVTALRDEAGRPVRSIVVGVNVSADGYVLKAGILGNMEIGSGDVSVDWAN